MFFTRKSIGTVAALAAMFGLGYGIGSSSDIGQKIVSAALADPGGRQCSAQTLKGAYGIKFEGLSLSGGQFASVSRIVFDGQGVFTTQEIGRFNGQLVERTFTGPYTVNSDCTGILDFTSTISNPPHQAHGNFVIINSGQGFYIIDNEDGWVANGVGSRI